MSPAEALQLRSLVGIGISTIDRWDDLRITLSNLREAGLDQLETWVVDDGSKTPLPESFPVEFPWVKFERSETWKGLCAQRNNLARKLSTPLILGLDDDSFPVAGDLLEAAQWLLLDPKAMALALRIVYHDDPAPAITGKTTPHRLGVFIGCAYLIKREPFLSLGGYEERFEYVHEESEFCLRAFLQGYSIYYYPDIVIRHIMTPVSRFRSHREMLNLRNQVLILLWYYPSPLCWLRALKMPVVTWLFFPRNRKYWKLHLIGFHEGFRAYFSWPKKTKRLNAGQFRVWKKFPNPW